MVATASQMATSQFHSVPDRRAGPGDRGGSIRHFHRALGRRRPGWSEPAGSVIGLNANQRRTSASWVHLPTWRCHANPNRITVRYWRTDGQTGGGTRRKHWLSRRRRLQWFISSRLRLYVAMTTSNSTSAPADTGHAWCMRRDSNTERSRLPTHKSVQLRCLLKYKKLSYRQHVAHLHQISGRNATPVSFTGCLQIQRNKFPVDF